jgi:putative phosphoesterase
LRLVILSDIHGNHLALQKVLDDVRRDGSSFVCLGDSLWGGPEPLEVLRELRALGCPVVMGNTDEFLIGKGSERVRGHWKDLGRWCYEKISDEDRTYVGTFKPTITLQLDGGLSLLCYHGSPRSNREGVYSTTSYAKLTRIMKGHREDILAGGHTHSQMVKKFGRRLVINPGSVGQPFEYKGPKPARILPQAEYAILDAENRKVDVSLRRVEYSINELRGAVEGSDMPHKDWWLKYWEL